MSSYNSYRWCMVLECKNTSVKTPNKLWIQLPAKISKRNAWLKAARRDPELLSEKTRLYFCEDHFDLEHDMVNYMQFKLMGNVKRIRLKPHSIPSRFDCWNKHEFASVSVQDHIEEDDVKASSSCIEDPLQNKDTGDIVESAGVAEEIQEGVADIQDGVEDIQDGVADIQDGVADIQDGGSDSDTEEQIFSWQRDSEINCEDFDTNLDNKTAENTSADGVVFKNEFDDTVEVTKLEDIPENDDQTLSSREESDVHEGYKCDSCKEPIRRFRYSCVECANYDLCGACEARAAHSQHYLLRIPRPRPHNEIQLIMDTIRRYLKADPKSLQAEANFVSTLIDEMKSEVLSEAGSDPVPDEPDYPIDSEESSDEHDDCEMEESNATETLASQDDVSQDVTYLEDDLQEREVPQEIYNALETIDKNTSENIQIQNIPRQRIRLSSSNSIGKVSKKSLKACPRKVTISDDVLKILKTKDGDIMQGTINTIKHSLQSKAFIPLQRLSTDETKSVTRIDINK